MGHLISLFTWRSRSARAPFICAGYTRDMTMLPSDLTRAGLAARDRLSEISRRTAAAGLPGAPTPTTHRLMAEAARAAIFADALLGAMRARLDEFKAVVR